MSIAFICALPTGLNPGMISVDLGIKAFLDITGLGSKHKASLYSTEKELVVSSRHGLSLNYKQLIDAAQLKAYDHIIYWGDFAHWINYAEKEWMKRGEHLGKSREELENKWYSLYFLENNKELLSKTIIFGGTLYGLNSTQLTNKRYADNLKKFFSKCKAAYFRDLYSANFINQVTSSNIASFSCDCALIRAKAINTLQGKAHKADIKTKRLGIAFGRSNNPGLLVDFSRKLAAQLNARIEPINWLGNRGIDGLIYSLQKIQLCDYFFTDIYHCGVNAIGLGIPTISTGSTSQEVDHTLSDKKKEVFFRQHLLQQYYLPTELIKDGITSNNRFAKQALKEISNRLKDSDSFLLAYRLIQMAASTSITELHSSMVER